MNETEDLFGHLPDVDVERREWSPTPEQFSAYQAREIETARANRALGRSLHGADFSSLDTLNSRATLLRVWQSD